MTHPPKNKVIILGAGWAGIIAAKTYLQISRLQNKPIELLVLDENASVGGVWSKDRLHAGLVANSPTGYYEYSDMSMWELESTHHHQRTIQGGKVQRYLEAYARRFGVFECIRFNSKVVRVRRKDQPETEARKREWLVETSSGEVFECASLIVATGLHSKPKQPQIPCSTYTGTVIHSQQLGINQKALAEDTSIKDVVVVGGCKSAVDACSAFRFAGKRVHWVIRPSEQGVPLTVANIEARLNQIVIGLARLFGVFSPSIYDVSSFWYRFLHSGTSKLGSACRKLYWIAMTEFVKWPIRYHASKNGSKIEPKRKTLFLDTAYIAVIPKGHPFLKWLHQDNPEILTVNRSAPSRLEGREMITIDQSGREERLKADVVVYATGWQPGHDFFSIADRLDMGLPIPKSELPPDYKISQEDQEWDALQKVKDKEVLSLFPYFATDTSKSTPPSESNPSTTKPPPQPPPDTNSPFSYAPLPPEDQAYTPIKLFRTMIPLSCISSDPFHPPNTAPSLSLSPDPNASLRHDHSITFPSTLLTTQTAQTLELQALWCVAWHEHLLPRSFLHSLHASSARSDTALTQAWMSRRFGSRSQFEQTTILETQGYLDLLCRDLELDRQRKKRRWRLRDGKGGWRAVVWEWIWWVVLGWWWIVLDEWIVPYRARDYEGIVDEFWREVVMKQGDSVVVDDGDKDESIGG